MKYFQAALVMLSLMSTKATADIAQKIGGWTASWRPANGSLLGTLDDVAIAFATVSAVGDITTPEHIAITAEQVAPQTTLWLSVGGGELPDGSKQASAFVEATRTEAQRNALAENLMEIVRHNKRIDGLEMDWEDWWNGSPNNTPEARAQFTHLLALLTAKLAKEKKQLRIALPTVVSGCLEQAEQPLITNYLDLYKEVYVTVKTFGLEPYVAIMHYDMHYGCSEGLFSPLNNINAALTAVAALGYKKDHTFLGAPLYGVDGQSDTVEQTDAKIALAKERGVGILFWHLSAEYAGRLNDK